MALPATTPKGDCAAPDPAALDQVMRHLADGDGAGAEARLAPLLAAFPANGDVLNLSGIAAHLLGRPEEAVALTRTAVATDPASAVFHANHGAALAAAGRPAEAAGALERSLALRPDHAPTRRNLGLALAEMGRGARALPILYRARDLAPDDAETHLALARCLRESGAREAAADAARAGLACASAPGLAEEARFLLAERTGPAAPRHAPAGYVRMLFDAYAPSFDAHLSGRLAYRTPRALAEAVAAAGFLLDGSADVLDLGCGTGLSGLAIRPFARAIVGIDLSPRMLERARATGVYSRLVEAELPGCLAAEPASSCDLAVAADVMIYLGDVGPVLSALARVLRPGGACALSFETLQQEGAGGDMAITDTLRFTHDPASIAEAMRAHGFDPLLRREVDLRLERGRPVPGFILVARRR